MRSLWIVAADPVDKQRQPAPRQGKRRYAPDSRWNPPTDSLRGDPWIIASNRVATLHRRAVHHEYPAAHRPGRAPFDRRVRARVGWPRAPDRRCSARRPTRAARPRGWACAVRPAPAPARQALAWVRPLRSVPPASASASTGLRNRASGARVGPGRAVRPRARGAAMSTRAAQRARGGTAWPVRPAAPTSWGRRRVAPPRPLDDALGTGSDPVLQPARRHDGTERGSECLSR